MELTLSFGSLARQYRSFLIERSKAANKKVNDLDVKLYITKIENNCILAEMAGATAIMGSLFSVMEYANVFVDFVKNINTSILYFKNLVGLEKVQAQEIPYSKRECEDFANFLSVVSNNKGGELGLSVAEYAAEDGDKRQLVKFTFTSEEAFEAKKGALLAQRALDAKGEADYKNVLLYFYQANIDDSKSEGKTTEKAVIRSISSKELPVFFVSELDQDRIRDMKDNPSMNLFKASYRVDVNVEMDRHDMPRFYRVLRLHEIIPESDSE